MRALLTLMLIGTAGAHTAAACPRGALCVAADAERAEIPVPAAPRKPLRVQLAAPADSLPALRFSTERRTARADGELPSLWAALRTRVYAQLPTQRSESVTLTLALVVVKGQYDTIPGLGVAGDF